MPDDSTKGQAPDPAAGQSPPSPPEGTGAPADGLTPEAAAAELARARQEAAKYRTDLRGVQDELKALRAEKEAAAEAEKSELQKAIDRASRLEADLQSANGRLRDVTLRAEVLVAAQKADIVDPDAAYRLLDTAEVEYDGDRPSNIDALLTKLVEVRPYLKGKGKATGGTQTTSTTQPNSTQGKRPLTRADIEKMTDDEINAAWDTPEFQEAMQRGT